MEHYLSTIITNEELNTIEAGKFNILKAPRGWGKTTFMFDTRITSLSRAYKHILYLVHNKATRDSIAQLNPSAAALEGSGDGAWLAHRKKDLWTSEEDENHIHVMCYQTFAALLRHEGKNWLNDIDLIIWDEFDDIKSYYDAEVKKLKKMLPHFSYEKLVATLQEGNSNSIVNFVYQMKTAVLEPAKIKLIAVSATPENAALYFRDYINYILKGKLEEIYDAQNTIFIESIVNAIKQGIIKHEPGRKFWCYTKFITDARRLELMFHNIGFNVLVLWSPDNKTYETVFNEEQKDGLNEILKKGMVPPQYDMVITTNVVGRSVSVYDTSFQDWICNSNEYEDVGQFIRARFKPERQYLLTSAKGLIDFTREGFPVDYYEWHSISELRNLIKEKPFYTKSEEGKNRKKLPTFSAVLKEYPNLFEKRRYGNKHEVQYRIKPFAALPIIR